MLSIIIVLVLAVDSSMPTDMVYLMYPHTKEITECHEMGLGRMIRPSVVASVVCFMVFQVELCNQASRRTRATHIGTTRTSNPRDLFKESLAIPGCRLQAEFRIFWYNVARSH